jgi:hypothetical protein
MKTVEMTDLNEGIVELYAEHLLKKASSVVVTFTVVGAISGAVLGGVPGLLSHSLISPGANYFAILLGAIAGGFVGRSLGDKRAVGLRLQGKMALHQLQVESRLVAPTAAQGPRSAAPAPAPVAAHAPAVSAAAAVAPPAAVLPLPRWPCRRHRRAAQAVSLHGRPYGLGSPGSSRPGSRCPGSRCPGSD